MDKKQIEELIAATGALAEMSYLFFKSAITAGATFEEALALTQVFLSSMLTKPNNN